MSNDAPDRGRGKGCLGCLAVIVVVALVAATVFILRSRAHTASLYERFTERGLPTSLAELDDWYEHIPNDENAAIGFMAAADGIIPTRTEAENNLPVVGRGETPVYGPVLDTERATTARGYLDANSAALKLAHEAARRTRSRYPINFNQGVSAISSVQLPVLGKLRSIGRLLSLEAMVRAHEGNAAGATDSILAVYAVSDSLSNEPMLISQLVTIALESLAAQDVGHVLSASSLSRDDLDRIAEVTASRDPREGYRRGVAGEAAFGLFDTSPMNPMANPIFTFDRDRYGANIEFLLDASALPLRDAVDQIDSISRHTPSVLVQRLFPFSSMMLQPLSRAFDATVRAVEYRDLVQVIAAIEKFRLDHNALPDTLDQLVPDYLATIPDDPYSNGLILYLQENPGYVVYSIGVDHRDGHGEKVTGTGGDINLRVTR